MLQQSWKMVSQSKLPIQNQNISWDKDGENSPDDPMTSAHILIKFMTTPGNIVKHRNGTNGKSKESYHQILRAEMIAADTIKHRCTKDMWKKILIIGINSNPHTDGLLQLVQVLESKMERLPLMMWLLIKLNTT